MAVAGSARPHPVDTLREPVHLVRAGHGGEAGPGRAERTVRGAARRCPASWQGGGGGAVGRELGGGAQTNHFPKLRHEKKLPANQEAAPTPFPIHPCSISKKGRSLIGSSPYLKTPE